MCVFLWTKITCIRCRYKYKRFIPKVCKTRLNYENQQLFIDPWIDISVNFSRKKSISFHWKFQADWLVQPLSMPHSLKGNSYKSFHFEAYTQTFGCSVWQITISHGITGRSLSFMYRFVVWTCSFYQDINCQSLLHKDEPPFTVGVKHWATQCVLF